MTIRQDTDYNIGKNKLRLTSYGAGREVGRSAFIIEDRDRRILLDAGIKLVPYDKSLAPKGLKERAKDIDVAILSHAHVDHSGYFPTLWENGYHGKLHMTEPTRDITYLLWKDHFKIEGNRHWGEDGLDYAYSNINTCKYQEKIKIADGITAEFFNSGHILGSAMILLDWDGCRILYTGDINDQQTPLFEGFEIPDEKIDILITESTNGIRDLQPRQEVNIDFKKHIKHRLEAGKKVIVPSFAIGRSQELLCIITEEIKDYPIYVDGMINKMNTITEKYLNKKWVDEPILDRLRREKTHSPFTYENIIPITRENVDRTGDFRRFLGNSTDPAIIVTTSGMLMPSPVHTHLQFAAKDKGNLIALTGYQVKGTLGRDILDGKRKVSLSNGYKQTKTVNIHARVERFGFSGHTSSNGISDLIDSVTPNQICLIHGDPENQNQLSRKLSNGVIPEIIENNKTILLNS